MINGENENPKSLNGKSFNQEFARENFVLPDARALPEFPENKMVYTVFEVQDILGIGLSTTYSLIKSRQFHSVKAGGRVLVSKKSFDKWLQG